MIYEIESSTIKACKTSRRIKNRLYDKWKIAQCIFREIWRFSLNFLSYRIYINSINDKESRDKDNIDSSL